MKISLYFFDKIPQLRKGVKIFILLAFYLCSILALISKCYTTMSEIILVLIYIYLLIWIGFCDLLQYNSKYLKNKQYHYLYLLECLFHIFFLFLSVFRSPIDRKSLIHQLLKKDILVNIQLVDLPIHND